MEIARLDYPLVEELDKIADKFARDDKGPQPAVTDYRGMATTEMPVATSKFPTTRYSLVELLPKTGAKTSAPPSPETSSPSDYWRQQARRSAPEP